MRRLVMAVVAVLGVSAGAEAQPIAEPQTFNVLARTNRGQGTYTSASVTVPEGVGAIQVTDMMTDAVASNPDHAFTLVIERSLDGAVWQPVYMEMWRGGTFVDSRTGLTVVRHFNSTIGAGGVLTGQRVRFTLDMPVAINNIGFNVTVRPIE